MAIVPKLAALARSPSAPCSPTSSFASSNSTILSSQNRELTPTPIIIPVAVSSDDSPDLTIAFGIVGTLIGVIGIALAGLQVRKMYVRKKLDDVRPKTEFDA